MQQVITPTITKEFQATVTQRGQVTIPAEVRRMFGTKRGDKVSFAIEGDQVRLRPARFTLESSFGSVTPMHRPEDFERIKEEALEDRVEDTVRELQNSQ